MAVEYSYVPVQTVAVDENVLFNNCYRACRKGAIEHDDASGAFYLRGLACRAIYEVSFTANIAIAAGGTVEPISVALTVNGETRANTIATVTPAAIGDFWNVSIHTFVDVSCDCCKTVAIENVSATTAIDVANANIIFARVA